jgi:hypothetical protein
VELHRAGRDLEHRRDVLDAAAAQEERQDLAFAVGQGAIAGRAGGLRVDELGKHARQQVAHSDAHHRAVDGLGRDDTKRLVRFR